MTTKEKEQHDNKLIQKYRELLKEDSYPPHLISEAMRDMERRLNPVKNTVEKKHPRRRRNRNPPRAKEEASVHHKHAKDEVLGEQIAQSNIIQGSPPEKVEKRTNVPKKRKNKKNKAVGTKSSIAIKPLEAPAPVEPVGTSKGTTCQHGRYPGDCRTLISACVWREAW